MHCANAKHKGSRFRACLPAIAVCLLFSACIPAERGGGNGVAVYYAHENGALHSENRTPPEGAEVLAFALEQIVQPPTDPNLHSVLPPGAAVLGHTLEDGLLTVSVGEGYAELSPIDRSVAEAGFALTFTALDGVERVLIVCEALPGQALPLSAEDLLFADPVIRPLEREVILYFVGDNGLAFESRAMVVRENEHLARHVAESLLNGTQSDHLRSPIPQRTQLLSATVDQGVCYLNLSGAFVIDAGVLEEQRLALAVLVYSLTELEDIERVQLLVEDAFVASYGGILLDTPLSRGDVAA